MSRALAISSIVVLAAISCAQEAPTVPEGESGGSADNGGSQGPGGSSVIGSGGSGGTSTGASGSNQMQTGGSGGSSGGSSTGGSGGTSTGTGGSGGSPTSMSDGGTDAGGMMASDVAKALDGLRIDDVCASKPQATESTCNHVMNPYHASKDATIGGTAGTTYNVTIKIRGVVEPTIINGGSKPDAQKAPQFNLEGTPGDATYQPWFLHISNPSATYYLNNFGFTRHQIFAINWEETIPMAAGATVTLDVRDSNDHEISNTQGAQGPIPMFTGTPAVADSMNSGQYVQINVVSAVPK